MIPQATTALTADAARQAILAAVRPLGEREEVALKAALGRVLAADVVAPRNVPAHDNSAMDGYALRFEDLSQSTESRFRVVGTALAGKPFGGRLGSGEAIRIMTGAVIPPGADCVVMQEDVQRHEDELRVPPGQKAGQNLRRAGEDLAAGSVALKAGKRLGPAELGLVASLGIASVTVFRRLRVAVFSTGDELTPVGEPLAPGQIHDSNGYTLFGALHRLGCEVRELGVVPDEPATLEAALREAASQADAVITSGGVSVGDADYVKELIARLGEVAFWKIQVKPGRPMAFGRIGDAWLFGLPGNPVAALVAFYQFAQDALLTLMGVSPLPHRPLFPARCLSTIRKPLGRREFCRGKLHPAPEGWSVGLTGPQGSGMLHSMSEADCFIVLDEAQGDVTPGDTVQVQLFEGLV